MKNIDYVGTEINGLKILNYFCTKEANQSRRCYLECLCFCGKIFKSRAESIKKGIAKSCGCKRYELSALAHTLDNELVMSKRVYNNYKNTAIRKGILFLLSINEFKQLICKNCFYCGSSPKLSKWVGSTKWKTKDKFFIYNGVDRVDNSVGYIIDNCVPCCSICNGAKSDLSLEEFQNWINQLISFKNE